MNKLDARLLYVASALAVLTGVAYGCVRYFFPAHDEFALGHPWEGPLQHAHVLAVPLLVLALGGIWHVHALRHWRHRVQKGRRTGLAQMTLALPMIVSGYVLQISGEPTVRLVWAWIHGITSLAWMAGFAAHAIIHWRERRTRRADRAGG